MRALRPLLRLISVVTLAAALASCGDDVASKIMCNDGDDATCLKVGQALFDVVDASVAAMPRCCTGVCVLQSPGCDTGFRYLTSEPGYGACAASVMCAAVPDMTFQPDLASRD